MSNKRLMWIGENDPPDHFPPVESALREPDGLLAAGGDLAPERLLWAYRHGIFPWYDEGQPLLWWSPDPRCVFQPGNLRVARRLQRTLRNSAAEVRVNTAFTRVIRACARPRRYTAGTWITQDVIAAFETLHAQGWAHSVEIWEDGELKGGLYGLAIGKAFFGESMWSDVPNASKIALIFLDRFLAAGEFDLLDCQVVSQHLQSLGAITIARPTFTARLEAACASLSRFEKWPIAPIPVAQLVNDRGPSRQ